VREPRPQPCPPASTRGRAGRSARCRESRLAVDRRAIGEYLGDVIRGQIDRGDARLRQGFDRGRAIGIRDHQFEFGEIRIAGVETAVVIGVEHVLQRLQVGRCRRIPIGENDLVRIGDLVGVVRIEEKHRIARARPSRAIFKAIARKVDKRVRRRQRRDVDSLARQIEDDGAIVLAKVRGRSIAETVDGVKAGCNGLRSLGRKNRVRNVGRVAEIVRRVVKSPDGDVICRRTVEDVLKAPPFTP
jgi:hypothetical protein